MPTGSVLRLVRLKGTRPPLAIPQRYVTSVLMDHPFEANWRVPEGLTKTAAAEFLGMTVSQYCDVVVGRTELSAAKIRDCVQRLEGRVTADEIVMWRPSKARAAS